MNYPAFVGASYQSQSYVADAEDLINRYIEILESEGATTKTALLPVPGFRSYGTFTIDGCRGLYTDPATGRAFGVFYTTLVEIAVGGAMTARGTVASDPNPVTFASNAEDQLMISGGGLGYCFTLSTNTLTNIAGLVATSVDFLDGYFLAFDKPNNRFRISDLFDGLVWDPTQFLTRSTNADPWQAQIVTPTYQVVMPGTETGDILSNVGTFPFPFAPDKSAAFAMGCAATFSIQTGSQTTWISKNRQGGFQVVASQGYNPKRISHHALELAMKRMSRVDDAIGQTYEENGHPFLLLTFPTANVTWCFDFSTEKWHKRGTWIAEENRYIYSRAVFHCVFDGKHLMGDREGATVYDMTDEVFVDVDSRPLRWLRRAPALQSEHKRIIVHRIELLMDVAVGLVTGQGSDPVVMIRASRNFGQTFGSERQMKIGEIGEHWRRVYATRFGVGRGWVFEVSGTDPVPMRISGALLDVERLAA